MNSKEAIIDKILGDATAAAKAVADEASASASAAIADAEKKAASYIEEKLSCKDALVKAIAERKATVAALDARKMVLSEKSALIDRVFDEVIGELKKDKKKYLGIVTAMITDYADDGDKVVVCEEDAKIFDKKFVTAAAKVCGKDIALSDKYGDFKGGIVLESANCDKNLTLDSELKTIREEIEPLVAARLFGDAL